MGLPVFYLVIPPITQDNQIVNVILFIKIVLLILAPSKLIGRAPIINPSSSQVPYPIDKIRNDYPRQVFQLIAYEIE
ncbi:MAG: hypothetical protein EZS28_010007 [Streblomastix strix]|uniref:Uncharacterized protein n=1 Tax=Streblomastix strix TaxID=222440 RepID=A0A5J4WHI9_9EUKA|nr:MAG: hypothetical protein EZS28_010007 [Streblomastix strix]